MATDSFGIGSTLLSDVAFNEDGSLKQSGKQNVRFYNKKRLSFRARKDESGNLIMDHKTGLPAKEAFEEVVEMVRIETRGDTNIVDDIADDLRKKQFYRQYKYFRDGKIPDGHPIEDFDFLQPSTIMELHMYGIHILEQVAIMSDLECEQLKDQSGYEIRDIASQWMKINTPQGQAGKASRLEAENTILRRQLAESQASRGAAFQRNVAVVDDVVEEETVEVLELTPEQMTEKRGRGRPRKV